MCEERLEIVTLERAAGGGEGGLSGAGAGLGVAVRVVVKGGVAQMEERGEEHEEGLSDVGFGF